MTRQRAEEVYKQCLSQSHCGPWSDHLQKAMTPDEIKHVRKLWLSPDRPGYASFASTFLEIRNGRL